MNTKAYTKHQFITLLAGAILYLAPVGFLNAGPGTLANSPLFISNAVQPNVMFLIDDSGSMNWTELLNAGTLNPSPGGRSYSKADISEDNPPGTGNTSALRSTRRFLCRGYNVMAYNPNTLYTPWIGVDSAGNPYQDLTLTTARSNPYNTTETDIGSHLYWPWTDTNGDGEYGDATVSSGAANYAGDECGNVNNNSDGVAVNSLPATGTTATPNSQRNYANWYSYFRRREYVAKRALSQIIDESDARVGLTTLHNNNSVRTLIKDIDDISLPVNATAQTDKIDLLDNLFQVGSSGSTPLRSSLEDVGEYFDDGGSWGSSPILTSALGGACQQNFTVVMSDGYWNGGAPGVGDTDSTSNTIFDGGVYADGDTANTISNTLADVAMHYYETDLSGLADIVPTTNADTNTAQHLVTYTVAFGLNGTLSADPLPTDTVFNWPTPVQNTATTIDDMRHAAWNGRGLFLNAQNPGQLVDGLRSAIGSIQGRVGSAASVAFNSSSLSTNSEIYLALFNSERWSGDLLAYPLNSTTGAIGATSSWSAASRLDGRNLSTSARTILTFDGTDGNIFQWANLSTAQKNDLRTGPSGSVDDDATATARLGYIRGDRACEVGSAAALTCNYTSGADTFTTKTLRERASRLGDILHSAPVFVGKPESNWSDIAPFPNTTGSLYSEYRNSNALRAGTIYTGGNDGMLHGFAQASGDEILAYIPDSLFSTSATEGLHFLTDPGYTHKYYVDQTPTVSDVYIRTTTAGSRSWKTVLVGSLRGGGRGLFALDVTNPAAYSETGTAPQDVVMWEFDNADDPDLGYTYSQPIIVALRGPSNSIRWAAILGNGYNDTGSGEAKLFILFLEDGLDGVWDQAAGDYIEITTGVGDATNRNGLASPAVIDENGDGWADRVYAGDLNGNMWAFDISGSNAGNWDVAHQAAGTPVPLFTANANQQITSTPVIVRNSDIPTAASNSPNTLVIFGTGQYLTSADISTTNTQAMYGIWDDGTSQLDQTDLVAQTITAGTSSGGVPGRTLSNNTVDYTGTAQGWYINLPTSGERSVTDAVIRDDLVFFNTTIPDTVPCNYGGTGWLMVAKWINGGNPDDVAFDLNGDYTLSDLDKIDSKASAGMSITGMPTSPSNLGNKRYVATTETDSGDSIEVTEIENVDGPGTGRLSWEEMEL